MKQLTKTFYILAFLGILILSVPAQAREVDSVIRKLDDGRYILIDYTDNNFYLLKDKHYPKGEELLPDGEYKTIYEETIIIKDGKMTGGKLH